MKENKREKKKREKKEFDVRKNEQIECAISNLQPTEKERPNRNSIEM